jgi:hypothetical protein
MKAAETACRNLAKMMKIFGVKIGGNGYRSCYFLFYAFLISVMEDAYSTLT